MPDCPPGYRGGVSDASVYSFNALVWGLLQCSFGLTKLDINEQRSMYHNNMYTLVHKDTLYGNCSIQWTAITINNLTGSHKQPKVYRLVTTLL